MAPLCPSSVLISGANRGIGLGFVKQFVKLSTPPKFVFATCRSPEIAKELQDLAKVNKTVIILQLDVSNLESIEKCAAVVRETLKDAGLNLLINNAAVHVRDTGLLDADPEAMVEMFKINAMGPMMLTRALLPLLKQARSNPPISEGRPMSINQSAVVNIASSFGSIGETNDVHNSYGYRTSKAALNMVSKLLSIELKVEGIFVIGIHPGWVQTAMGGPGSKLPVEDSVRSMMDLMETFEGDTSHGKYLNWTGKEMQW